MPHSRRAHAIGELRLSNAVVRNEKDVGCLESTKVVVTTPEQCKRRDEKRPVFSRFLHDKAV
jgi:hypothetical protein